VTSALTISPTLKRKVSTAALKGIQNDFTSLFFPCAARVYPCTPHIVSYTARTPTRSRGNISSNVFVHAHAVQDAWQEKQDSAAACPRYANSRLARKQRRAKQVGRFAPDFVHSIIIIARYHNHQISPAAFNTPSILDKLTFYPLSLASQRPHLPTWAVKPRAGPLVQLSSGTSLAAVCSSHY
jgi:hypothetical protein